MDYRASEHLIRIFDFGVLHLELNTALFIFVLVLVVTLAMNLLLFRPVLRSLDRRGALLSGVRHATEQRRGEIARLEAEYQQRLAQVREEVNRYRQEARREAQREAGAILADAHRVADRELRSALRDVEREAAQLRAGLIANVGALAERITTRVLE